MALAANASLSAGVAVYSSHILVFFAATRGVGLYRCARPYIYAYVKFDGAGDEKETDVRVAERAAPRRPRPRRAPHAHLSQAYPFSGDSDIIC